MLILAGLWFKARRGKKLMTAHLNQELGMVDEIRRIEFLGKLKPKNLQWPISSEKI
jgi:hypothetical protein